MTENRPKTLDQIVRNLKMESNTLLSLIDHWTLNRHGASFPCFDCYQNKQTSMPRNPLKFLIFAKFSSVLATGSPCNWALFLTILFLCCLPLNNRYFSFPQVVLKEEVRNGSRCFNCHIFLPVNVYEMKSVSHLS